MVSNRQNVGLRSLSLKTVLWLKMDHRCLVMRSFIPSPNAFGILGVTVAEELSLHLRMSGLVCRGLLPTRGAGQTFRDHGVAGSNRLWPYIGGSFDWDCIHHAGCVMNKWYESALMPKLYTPSMTRLCYRNKRKQIYRNVVAGSTNDGGKIKWLL